MRYALLAVAALVLFLAPVAHAAAVTVDCDGQQTDFQAGHGVVLGISCSSTFYGEDSYPNGPGPNSFPETVTAWGVGVTLVSAPSDLTTLIVFGDGYPSGGLNPCGALITDCEGYPPFGFLGIADGVVIGGIPNYNDLTFGAGPLTLSIDDGTVVLEPSPEPATFGLLALGLIGIGARYLYSSSGSRSAS